mmetsp:Transcript_5161/g.18267  ORF Transcript_5161/g.18267 Transcript_5161/m.18267 type:complete len:221 (-) Transcript_5161:1369-2031(-)
MPSACASADHTPVLITGAPADTALPVVDLVMLSVVASAHLIPDLTMAVLANHALPLADESAVVFVPILGEHAETAMPPSGVSAATDLDPIAGEFPNPVKPLSSTSAPNYYHASAFVATVWVQILVLLSAEEQVPGHKHYMAKLRAWPAILNAVKTGAVRLGEKGKSVDLHTLAGKSLTLAAALVKLGESSAGYHLETGRVLSHGTSRVSIPTKWPSRTLR